MTTPNHTANQQIETAQVVTKASSVRFVQVGTTELMRTNGRFRWHEDVVDLAVVDQHGHGFYRMDCEYCEDDRSAEERQRERDEANGNHPIQLTAEQAEDMAHALLAAAARLREQR